ncbi:MAG: DUF2796 domain-containing protein [Henriciella sp.]|nr:DUF2796 domain-containing protein [Henriciella sp.]
MSRSVFFLAASTLALAACQPAEEAADSLEAEAPPIVEETVEVEVETVAAESDDHDGEDHAETAADDHGDEHGEDHDHDHDEHDHGDEGHGDEDHGDEDHADHDHDHDDHDHEAHDDHDHGDHDHGAGEAHVHGLSDLAATLNGSTLSISIEGAMANFDLDETLRTLDDTTPFTDGTVEVIGGDCTRDSAEASIRPISNHGNLMIDLTYTCAAPGAIEAIEVTGFQSFAGFEEVNAVFLTDAGQTAETLTESDTRLDIS